MGSNSELAERWDRWLNGFFPSSHFVIYELTFGKLFSFQTEFHFLKKVRYLTWAALTLPLCFGFKTYFSLICFLPGGLPVIFSAAASCCKPEILLLAGCAGDRTCSEASLMFAAPSLPWLPFASSPIPHRQKAHMRDTIEIQCPVQFLMKSPSPWALVNTPIVKNCQVTWKPWEVLQLLMLWTPDQLTAQWAGLCPQPVIALNGVHRNAG